MKLGAQVIDKLATAIHSALKTPIVRERLNELAFEPYATTPKELATLLASDTNSWAPVVKATGFTIDE
jgi:tripartite-type tricarboxylate transporter receptor subunit TctC